MNKNYFHILLLFIILPSTQYSQEFATKIIRSGEIRFPERTVEIFTKDKTGTYCMTDISGVQRYDGNESHSYTIIAHDNHVFKNIVYINDVTYIIDNYNVQYHFYCKSDENYQIKEAAKGEISTDNKIIWVLPVEQFIIVITNNRILSFSTDGRLINTIYERSNANSVWAVHCDNTILINKKKQLLLLKRGITELISNPLIRMDNLFKLKNLLFVLGLSKNIINWILNFLETTGSII